MPRTPLRCKPGTCAPLRRRSPPRRRNRQRKDWLAQATYDLILCRSRLRTKVEALRALGDSDTLALALSTLRETRREVRRAVRTDKAAWRAQVVSEMQEAHIASDSRLL